MIILQDLPALSDLHRLIKSVDRYPITARKLVETAENEHYPLSVVGFYKSFPEDEVFEDAEDLWARTDQVEMLHHENAPAEVMFDSEQD